jgi:hypothetical protein
VKGNSIFITGRIYQGNSIIWENNLSENKKIIIHLFPGQLDEKATFHYVDYCDNDKEKAMVLEHQAGKVVFTSEPLGTTSIIELKCEKKPSKILFDTIPVKFNYDKTRNMASVQIEKNTSVHVEVLPP